MAGADIAFWALLVIATGLGGARAVAGIPALLAIVLPNAVVPAHAAVAPHIPLARLAIDPPPPASPYAPQVLYPVVAHARPDWLSARTDPAPASPSAGTMVKDPKVAIVIDDLGGDLAHTDRAIALPKPVTLSFLPFDEATPWLSAEAARAGHEILVHMPMEAEGDHNPGPLALTVGLSPDEIRRRLTLALARVPGAIGINNHMGSRFTADRASLVPVAEELAARHLIFFDSRTTAATQVVAVAHAFGVPSTGRDVFLDDEQTAGAVDTQLAELEARARTQGIAIAIGHPHDVTLQALAAWTARAPSRGFTLVTLSEALRLKAERDARQARAGE
ncbi:MAG: divergent polysaccharide deacetylase family protein [Proteobacteria bacterium]|nr:divergent polysaccharide deacetylase family protein [Pseudomonadota bacterium]